MGWGGAGLREWGKAGFLSQEVGPDGWVALRAMAQGSVAPHHGQWLPSSRDLSWLTFLLIFGVSQVRRALLT